MISEIGKIISSVFMMSTTVYLWTKFNKKNNYPSLLKLLSVIAILSVISIFNYYIINQYIRILSITVVLIICYKVLFKESMNKCIITPLFTQLLTMISETIYALILIFILKQDSNSIVNNFFGGFIPNITISIILIAIIRLKIVTRIYNKIIEFTDKIKRVQLIIFSFIVTSIANIFAALSYYKVNFYYIIIFNTLVTIISYLIMFYSFKTQNKYNRVNDKYNIAINSLNDYEYMMKKYRISNHENKNLLLVIRAMIINKEKDIPKYIDSIIEKKYDDNEKLLMEVNVIPSGGLKATIYSEIIKIKENNINYNLLIDKKIKALNLIELSTNTIIDICKIIGVLIDNAIDEVLELQKKYINISLYINNSDLYIKVSNNYQNKINLDKIYTEGYTTKGDGHGYGLCLVKNIIEKNPQLDNEIEISKTVFSQILIIKNIYKKIKD